MYASLSKISQPFQPGWRELLKTSRGDKRTHSPTTGNGPGQQQSKKGASLAQDTLRSVTFLRTSGLTTTATATATEVAFAAATTPTTATSAESTTTATAAEITAGTFLTGTGFVDSECSTVEFFAVEIGHGFIGFFLRAHLHEGKSAGLARKFVHDEFATGDITGLFEQVQNVAFSRIERQVAHE
jgi:hypothetical protein